MKRVKGTYEAKVTISYDFTEEDKYITQEVIDECPKNFAYEIHKLISDDIGDDGIVFVETINCEIEVTTD